MIERINNPGDVTVRQLRAAESGWQEIGDGVLYSRIRYRAESSENGMIFIPKLLAYARHGNIYSSLPKLEEYKICVPYSRYLDVLDAIKDEETSIAIRLNQESMEGMRICDRMYDAGYSWNRALSEHFQNVFGRSDGKTPHCFER